MVEHLTLNQGVLGSSPRWCTIWPVGQAVKTPASHAGNGGSIPPRVTIAPTSAGKESFPRRSIYIYAYLAQSVEHAAVNRRVVGSSPTVGAKIKTHHMVCLYFLFFTYAPNLRACEPQSGRRAPSTTASGGGKREGAGGAATKQNEPPSARQNRAAVANGRGSSPKNVKKP